MKVINKETWINARELFAKYDTKMQAFVNGYEQYSHGKINATTLRKLCIAQRNAWDVYQTFKERYDLVLENRKSSNESAV